MFLDIRTLDFYYNGFCNTILWPLFHYLSLPVSVTLDATTSFDAQFAAYEKANKAFADVVMTIYQVMHDALVFWRVVQNELYCYE